MKNEILLQNGLKVTKARKLIISILEKSEQPISAEDLYEIFKKKEDSNLSTICLLYTSDAADDSTEV